MSPMRVVNARSAGDFMRWMGLLEAARSGVARASQEAGSAESSLRVDHIPVSTRFSHTEEFCADEMRRTRMKVGGEPSSRFCGGD